MDFQAISFSNGMSTNHHETTYFAKLFSLVDLLSAQIPTATYFFVTFFAVAVAVAVGFIAMHCAAHTVHGNSTKVFLLPI